jgi:hypothetical protein
MHTGSPKLHTDSPKLLTQMHTDSPKLLTQMHTGSPKLHTQMHTDSPKLHTQMHTGSPKLLTQTHTDSPKLLTQMHTGSIKLHTQMHTGSPKLLTQMHTDSSKLHTQIHTSSPKLHTQMHTCSPKLHTQMHTNRMLLGEEFFQDFIARFKRIIQFVLWFPTARLRLEKWNNVTDSGLNTAVQTVGWHNMQQCDHNHVTSRHVKLSPTAMSTTKLSQLQPVLPCTTLHYANCQHPNWQDSNIRTQFHCSVSHCMFKWWVVQRVDTCGIIKHFNSLQYEGEVVTVEGVNNICTADSNTPSYLSL